MTLPAAAGFVHGTDKTELASVSQFYDTGLAVQKTANAIRGHTYRLAVPDQECIQATVALAIKKGFRLQPLGVPAAYHLGFTQLGDFEVVWMDIHVADNLDLRDSL